MEVTLSSSQMAMEISRYLETAIVGSFILSIGHSNNMYNAHQSDMSVTEHRNLLVTPKI